MKLYFGICLCVAAFLLTECAKILDPKIVNGGEARDGQFPWAVTVIRVTTSSLAYCAGAVISDRWILTTAYCINGAETLIVMYNSVDLSNGNVKVSLSDDYTIHKDYDPKTLHNNIGLIFLNESLSFNNKLKPISLAEVELNSGTEVTVTGWGITSDDSYDYNSDLLHYIKVTTIDNEECLAAYGLDVVYPGLVCTAPGEPAKNPCKGDGGAPAVVNADTDKPLLVALFSFASNLGCESPLLPAGFTRTAYYREWIKSVTRV